MKLTAFLLSVLLCLAGCRKDPVKTENMVEFLAAGNWHMTAAIYDNVFGRTDVYATYPPCRKDDYIRFFTDGNEEINEGPSVCNSGDPQSRTQHWEFTNQYYNKIIINGEAFSFHKIDDHTFNIVTWFTDPYANSWDITYSR